MENSFTSYTRDNICENYISLLLLHTSHEGFTYGPISVTELGDLKCGDFAK